MNLIDDIPNAPLDLRVRVLEEEVRLLREEAGRCDSVYVSAFVSGVRCRKARGHIGQHRAFGVGPNGGDEDGRLQYAYWFQEW